MLWVLLIGILLGAAGAMLPAGPSAVLAYARAAEGRFREARAVALGRVTAESLYAVAGWWGMGHLLKAFSWLEPTLDLLVGLILPAIGVHLLRWKPRSGPAPTRGASRVRRKGFAMGFSLTALNPTVIASWGAVAAMLAATGWFPVLPRHAPLFGLGIALGAATWFHYFFGLLERRKESFKPRVILTVVRFLGGVLIVLGLWLLWNAARWFLFGES